MRKDRIKYNLGIIIGAVLIVGSQEWAIGWWSGLILLVGVALIAENWGR